MKNPYTSKAYDYLRKRILSGALQPGAFLSAQSLSREIGLSRTPMREALRLLEYDELVTIVPKLGAVVKKLSHDQFHDLLGYRQALETYTAGRAATMRRPEEVDLLKAALEKMNDQVNSLMGDPHDMDVLMSLGECDVRFHRLLFLMARNSLVEDKFERVQILQRVVLAALITRAPAAADSIRENVQSAFQEHTEIFEAIRDRNSEEAQDAMSRHMCSFVAKASKRTSHASVDTHLSAGTHELLI